MRILVTGSLGHIGKNLVRRLRELGHLVLRLDVVQLYLKDYIMCNVSNLSDAFYKIDDFKPELIYHLAAAVSRVTCELSPQNALNVNICGTLNIIQLALKYKAKLINFSTSLIYGDFEFNDDYQSLYDYRPNNIYGVSKWMALLITKYYLNDIIIINLRPNMIYDPNLNMVNNRSALIRFVKAALCNLDLYVHKNSFRGWLHMDDAIQLIVNALDILKSVSLNIGNKDIRPILLLANLVIKNVPLSNSKIIYIPQPPKMCRYKCPNLEKQSLLLKFEPKISIELGILLVINSAKCRLMLNK